MPLVPLSHSSAGGNDAGVGAATLINEASWIFRLCTEITAEATLNVYKILDLARHCKGYRVEADKWRDGSGDLQALRQALVNQTLLRGKGEVSKTPQEINDDYKALYVGAGAFLTWATNNLPGAGATVSNVTTTTSNLVGEAPELISRVPKLAAVTNQVNALLALFTS